MSLASSAATTRTACGAYPLLHGPPSGIGRQEDGHSLAVIDLDALGPKELLHVQLDTLLGPHC